MIPTGEAMTSERRNVVVVVLMLLGAGGVGVTAGALMGHPDSTPGRSVPARGRGRHQAGHGQRTVTTDGVLTS